MASGANGHDVQAAILEAIRTLHTDLVHLSDEVVELRGEVSTLRSDTNGRLDKLQMRVDEGFTQVNGRIDNLIGTAGGEASDHRERISRLEAAVFPTRH